ncbi:MAG: hypothetical protein ACYSSI_01940 [Planctomycetota bacterium]|jgi:hypothetical protein
MIDTEAVHCHQQILRKLSRQSDPAIGDLSVVESPGAKTSAWAIKVKSLSSYNVYNVCRVEIGDTGSIPIEIGDQTQAVNVAEPFHQTGTLSAGTYAMMFRVGDKYIFYVQV